MEATKKISVDPGFWIVICMLIMVVPWNWLGACVISMMVHECAHGGAVRLCGGTVSSIRIGPSGMVMDVTGLSLGRELICAMAGPAGSLLLFLLARWIPRTALCAAVHLLYNLLPMYPLDGGRVLRCTAELCFSQDTAYKIYHVSETLVMTLIVVLGFAAAFLWKLGFVPMLLCMMLFFRAVKNSLQTAQRAGTIVLP